MTGNRRFALVLLASAIVLVAGGCAASPGTGTSATPAAQTSDAHGTQSGTASAGERGVILFDMAHSEIFAAEDTSELGQSKAVERMRSAGYEVRVNAQPLTSESLDGVAALYVAGPMQPFTTDEETIVDDYLERGGTVVMSIHVPYPVLNMPAKWGLPVATGVMQSPNPVEGQQASIFTADSITDDEITSGVNSVLVVSGWPVRTDATKLATAKLVVQTAGDVIADTNANNVLDGGDLQAPFGVVGVAPVGSGRVIVLGDDGILANVGIDQADNAKLLDNILEVISAPKGA